MISKECMDSIEADEIRVTEKQKKLVKGSEKRLRVLLEGEKDYE